MSGPKRGDIKAHEDKLLLTDVKAMKGKKTLVRESITL